MAVQIPLLAVLILGERLNGQQWLGLGVALAGMFTRPAVGTAAKEPSGFSLERR